MPLLTTGISHHTATLEIREKIAIARTDYASRVNELRELVGVDAVIVVPTSNRT
jgi:glutamyl-tRNA reductase